MPLRVGFRLRSRFVFPGTVLIIAASASVTIISACASSPGRDVPRPIAPMSITEGDGVPLGSQIELALDQDPTVVHEVIDFRIADSSIASGIIVPSQGLVLIGKKSGETTADLRTADGVVRTITLIVKPSSSPNETVIDVAAGEIRSLGDDEITEWAASPPGSAVVMPTANSRGFSVVANEVGEVLVLLRSTPKGGEGSTVRLIHLYVHSAGIAQSSTPSALTLITDASAATASRKKDASRENDARP